MSILSVSTCEFFSEVVSLFQSFRGLPVGAAGEKGFFFGCILNIFPLTLQYVLRNILNMLFFFGNHFGFPRFPDLVVLYVPYVNVRQSSK